MTRRKNRNSQARPKPAQKPVAPIQTGTTNFSWRDHPVVVAALAAAGTFTITVFAFKEIIIPTQIADINNKIRDLPSLEQNIESLRNSSQKKDVEIQSLKKQVETLQQRNLFDSGDPTPTTFSKIRIGQPITDLESNFPAKNIDKASESYWNVSLDYGVFRDVTYYFDEQSKSKKITHISYSLPMVNEYSDGFLQDRLIEALGQPTSNPRKSFYYWKTKNYGVFKMRDESFLVLPPKTWPGYWPDQQS